MRAEDILIPTSTGICCKAGGFHIDPVLPVERALITHGHSDHARAGHGAVLATQETLDIMRLRYGDNFASSTQVMRYGENLKIDNVRVSFHPAGHVLGSAQIRVERAGLRIVASGDYKDVPIRPARPSNSCPAMFSFGGDVRIACVPSSRPGWRNRQAYSICRTVPERTHLVGAYTLGKAQRVIALLRNAGYSKTVYIHGAVEAITRITKAGHSILVTLNWSAVP